MQGPGKNISLSNPVTLSILDRLAIMDRKREVIGVLTPEESMRRFKESVRKNLEWVLNTRRVPVPCESEQLQKSVYYFGLRDLTGVSLASPSSEVQLLKEIQTAVEQFEPRIDDLRIISIPDASSKQRLTFRIEGRLVIEYITELVSFRTVLDMTHQHCEVQGKSNA